MTGEEGGEKEPRKSPGPRLAAILGIVAPTTLIGSLLVYLGYVATEARFEYFGLDLDLANLSSTDLLFYGSEAVFPMIVGFALIALISVGFYQAGKWLVATPRRGRWSGWISLALCYAGILLLIRASLGMFVTSNALLTGRFIEIPLSLLLGSAMLLYALWLRQAGAAYRQRASGTSSSGIPDWVGGILLILLIAGLFWTSSVAAGLYGVSRAEGMVKSLARKPKVVLYTRDALDDLPEGVLHKDLGRNRTFRHRYDGLRLLVESGGQLFLIPHPWSSRRAGVLVVQNSPDIRILLIPR